MSVLIKGMKMPKNCFRCDIHRACEHAWYLETDNRPSDCPLVEVPEPHGDLIDRDLLCDNLYDIDGYTEKAIDNAPTVIEAEE